SDPMTSHHHVSARYVPLASDTVAPAAGLDGLLLARRDDRRAIDVAPRAGSGVRVRANLHERRRRAAALRLERLDAARGEVSLLGVTARHHRPVHAGAVDFVGLPSGAYHLELRLPDRPVQRHALRLDGREHRLLRLSSTAAPVDIDRVQRPHRRTVVPRAVTTRPTRQLRPDHIAP
ncbi:MAG: hypothetical protein AAF772_19870, partial [Acidobacteriota bacterium]